MSRIRSIKPEFWTDERFCSEHTRDERMLYAALLNYCFDNWTGYYLPRSIKRECFPFDDDLSVEAIEGMMNALARTGRVVFFDHGGERCFWLPKASRHQVVNRPSSSPITLPDESSMIPHGALTESSLTTHAGKEGKGKEGKGEDARARETTRLLPPCFDQPPPFTLKPHAPDATCAQIAWSEAEQAFGAALTQTAAHTAAFASIVRQGCLPDCDGNPAQVGDCLTLLAGTLRREDVRGSWPQRKGLVRTILTQDRRRAES